MTTSLFQPLQVGRVTLKNRFVMAPLTRTRATALTHVPTPLMTEYYAQRASAGLIIAEATMIQEGHSAFYCEPGIYSKEQVAAWKQVTDQVHANGGKIALQIQHGGRVSHSINDGSKPVGPSAIAVEGHKIGKDFIRTGEPLDHEVPHELTDAEVRDVIGLFVHAAKNAIEAGFDLVEVHGANGYLVDQFWRESSNKRTGPYGGSVEARCQLPFEVVSAVAKAIGADRVGIRLSPLNSYNGEFDSNPELLTRTLLKKLDPLGLAYVHLMRADFFGVQKGDVLRWARESFHGLILANMGYEAAEAAAAIDAKIVDAVAFGTKFLANPDFPQRVAKGAELNALRPQFFYSHGAEGYTDYPMLP